MFAFLKKYIAQPSSSVAALAAVAEHKQTTTAAHWIGSSNEFIAEECMSLERLLGLFRQAFIDVETAPGGERLLLRGQSGMRMAFGIDGRRRLLQVTASFALREKQPMHDKLAAANRLNDQAVYLRAAVVDDTTLTLDHQLNYEGGVSKAAVVGMVRRLDHIAPRALQQMFGDALLA